MKKSILFASAAIAALAFTSCSNEVDMFQSVQSEDATIKLNVSNDVQMVTRASSAISANDYINWYVNVTPKAVDSTPAGGTTTTGWIDASSTSDTGIGSKTFKAGGYSIAVRNFEDENASYEANSGKGAAYYEGSIDKVLKKGSNSVTIDCSTAENCRVKVSLSGLSDLAAITSPSVTLSQTGRSATCPNLTHGETGYFKAGVEITYTLNYYYNEVEKHSTAATISSPAAATEYSIVASVTDEGKISLTIEYDSTFATGDKKDIIIDPFTGTAS